MKKIQFLITIFLILISNLSTQASQGAPDNGIRHYSTPFQEWKFVVTDIKGENVKIIKSNEGYWYLDSDKFRMSFSKEFKFLTTDYSFEIISMGDILGFRQAKMKGYTPEAESLDMSEDGVLKLPYEQKTNGRAVWIGPQKSITKLLTNAAYLANKIYTPIEFKSMVTKEMSHLTNTILDTIVLGKVNSLHFPASFTVKQGAIKIDISGDFIIGPRTMNGQSLQVISKVTNIDENRKNNLDATCKLSNLDEYMKYCCEQRLFDTNSRDINDFIYEGWKKFNFEKVQTLLDARNEEGETVFMRFLKTNNNIIKPNQMIVAGEKTPKTNMAEVFKVFQLFKLTKEQINKKNKAGNSVLAYALTYNCEKCADWLVEQGADLNERDYLNESLLLNALAGNSVKYTKLLMKLLPKKEWTYPPNKFMSDRNYNLPADPLSVGVEAKSHEAVIEFLSAKKIDSDTALRIIDRARNTNDGPFLAAAITHSTLNSSEMNKVTKDIDYIITSYTPDKIKQNKNYYDVLAKFGSAKKNPISAREQTADSTVYKIDIRLLLYNRIVMHSEQIPKLYPQVVDDSAYRSDKKSPWKLVFKNSENKIVDTVYIKLTKKDSWEKSFSNRKATINQKYSKSIKKIELYYKNSLKESIFANEEEPKIKYDSNQKDEKKQILQFSASATATNVTPSVCYLTNTEREVSFDTTAPFWIQTKNIDQKLLWEGPAHTVTSFDGPPRKSTDPEYIHTQIPIRKDTVFIEVYNHRTNKKLEKTLILPILIIDEKLEFTIQPKDPKVFTESIKSILNKAEAEINNNQSVAAIKNLQNIKSLVDMQISRNIPKKALNETSHDELIKIVDKAISFLKPSTKTPKLNNLKLEILAMASQDMNHIVLEATAKDIKDIYEENFLHESTYKLVTYTKDGKVFEERPFNYFEESVKNCAGGCDANMYWRSYLKMKYSPYLEKIKLFKGDTFLYETTIRHYELK